MENNEQPQQTNNPIPQQPQPGVQPPVVAQPTPAATQPQPGVQPPVAPLQPAVATPAQQPNAQPGLANQSQVGQQQAQNGEELISTEQIKWYRKYWWFAFVYLILPLGLFVGIYLLSTGTIYRKDKTSGLYKSVSKKEKSSLIILGLVLWSFAVL